MSHLSKAKRALLSQQDRGKIADAIIRLEAVLRELDAIGPMIGAAHLSHAIESLRETTSIAPPK